MSDPTHRAKAREGTSRYKKLNDAFYDSAVIDWEGERGTLRRGKVIGSRRPSLVEWEFQVLEVESES